MIESDMIAYEATERQAAFHAAPEMFRLYGGAMGGGKSYALCAEAIALSNDYPGNRGYLCRHELTSFRRTTLLTLQGLFDRLKISVKQHQTENYFALPNGSVIYYGGLGDDRKAIERLKSMELGWFGIDEASETVESFFLMLASRLRLKLPNIKYFGLLATNPDPGWIKSRFIDRKLPDHVFIPALPKDNPHLPDGYVTRLMGVFPPEWQDRFIKGDWSAFEGVNNVFPYQAILAAQARDLDPSEPVELGVDVARFGDDKTEIACRRGPVVRIVKTLAKADTMVTAGSVVIAKNDAGASALKVDTDGLGAGVTDRLRELGHEVIELHGGGKASETEKFKNAKAEWYWGFRDRLISGDVDLDPADLELCAQLTSCTYKIGSTGQLEITAKEDMKKRSLKSPDKAEAVIYAFATGLTSYSFVEQAGGDMW